MDINRRSELIEMLAQIEVDMEIVRKRMPQEVESFDKLMNSVDQLNSLGLRRNDLIQVLRQEVNNSEQHLLG